MSETQPVAPARLAGILAFVQAAAALKDTLRTGRTVSGRRESTADHSWRLCLLVMLFADELADVDLARLLQLCLVHDLAEAVTGDVPAPSQSPDSDRKQREVEALRELSVPLPEDLRNRIETLFAEYEAGRTLEAVLAKGFDKIETMLQHLIGANPPGFDYKFNLTYGRAITDRHPVLRQARAMLDTHTLERVDGEAN